MFLWLLTFYQTGPNGLFIFYQVFNLILQSALKKIINYLFNGGLVVIGIALPVIKHLLS